MPEDAKGQKQALRARIRQQRRVRELAERARADAALTGHLVELARGAEARSIGAYLSTPEEPSTRGFLAWAAAEGIRVLLPVSREDGLLDWATFDGELEAADFLGMPVPGSDILGPMAIDDADLILVPAACVDRTGTRMGWGRGYFDKTLGSMERRPPVYAVIFDEELVDSVPRERHDMPVDGVVTPSGVVTF